MVIHKTQGYAFPEAYITKNKQRVKQFNEVVYLKDGDEYEIELFNPKQTSVLAKIKLDGNYISNSGIVLRPGERIFLERYLDSNNKFVFKTYFVDLTNPTVKSAVKNNGLVSIEFFDESQPEYWTSRIVRKNWWEPEYYYDWGTEYYDYYRNNLSTAGESVSFANTSHHCRPSQSETGKTEMGETSSQSFVNSNRSFEPFSFRIIEWKILPISEKNYVGKEVNIIYCANCGAKRKKTTFKFCPHCGNKY